MAVQRSKVSRSKRGMRRSHSAIPRKSFYIEDGIYCLPHHANPRTGMYRGVQVFSAKDSENLKNSKKKDRESLLFKSTETESFSSQKNKRSLKEKKRFFSLFKKQS